MKLVHLRASVNVCAAIIGIAVLVFSSYFPSKKELFLSVEVLLLPTVYIVSNTYIEEFIKNENNELLASILKKSEELNTLYVKKIIKGKGT